MAPTYNDNLGAFTTFIAAYLHTLLYLRDIYPRTSFVQSRFHNTSVYQSRHPLVCEWITDAITAVRDELLEGTVARIAIVIFSTGNGKAQPQGNAGSVKIMERYMFDVSEFPVVPKNERNMEVEWEDNSSAPQSPNESDDEARAPQKPIRQTGLDADVDVNLSEQFRAALIALTTRTSKLASLPPNCSYNISMELRDEGDVDPPIRHPQPWVPVQPSLQKTGRQVTVREEEDERDIENGKQDSSAEGKDLGGVKVTPLRTVEAGVFRFETWIEEGKAKFDKAEGSSGKTSFASSGT